MWMKEYVWHSRGEFKLLFEITRRYRCVSLELDERSERGWRMRAATELVGAACGVV